MNENELIKKLHDGEEDAFEYVFKLHFKKLFLYADRFVKDKTVSEEIVEDFFCSLWENCSKISIETTISSYLFRSIHNRCMNHLRSIRVRQEYIKKQGVLEDSQVFEKISPDYPDKLLIYSEMEDRLRDTINLLPEKCRKIFLMNREEDMTYEEISEKLGVSVNTVKTQIMRALKKIRLHMKEFIVESMIFFLILL
ncbi:MAG TPA: RNA polymerase sigma-70 factor [Bacteroidales bacterium]|nr:RNA polymerase sigma-70 factor [Bacteroidales bacterium]